MTSVRPNERAWSSGFAEYAWIGLWFALVFGLLEVLVLTGQRFGFSSIIHRPRLYPWMTTASYFVLMMSIATALYGIGRFWKRARGLTPLVFALLLVGVGSNALVIGHKIYPWAIAIFTLSAATVSTRWIERRHAALQRAVHSTTKWLFLSVLLFGLIPFASYHLADRDRTTQRIGEGRPNVLLIILDTVRGANLSLYGYGRPTTPYLEELARRGVAFDRAVAPSSWTLASHASMFTGQVPSRLSANWDRGLNDRYPTLAAVLRDHGYRTAGFIANREFCTYEHGLDRGFDHYEDYGFGLADLMLSSGLGFYLERAAKLRPLIGTDDRLGLKRAEHIVDDFLRWVRRERDQPFFAFLNLFDAHDPYLPPGPWLQKFDPGRSSRLTWYKRQKRGTLVTREEIQSEMAAYDGAIAYMDSELRRLMEELARLGLDENTIVIVTSDHGEEFGRFGLLLHGHSLYPDQLFVPFLISHPGTVPAGFRVETPVSLQNLGPTIFDLVGVPTQPTFDGHSLASLWADTATVVTHEPPIISEVRRIKNGPENYPAVHGGMRSVLTGYEQVVTHDLGIVETFDWSIPGFPRLSPPQRVPATDGG